MFLAMNHNTVLQNTTTSLRHVPGKRLPVYLNGMNFAQSLSSFDSRNAKHSMMGCTPLRLQARGGLAQNCSTSAISNE